MGRKVQEYENISIEYEFCVQKKMIILIYSLVMLRVLLLLLFVLGANSSAKDLIYKRFQRLLF